MFTGIIKDIGMVQSVCKQEGEDLRLRIQTSLDLSGSEIGASIACAGCCLTVIEKAGNSFDVEVSAESISKTTIGEWEVGAKINLEPALKMGDDLGGHIVSGHVDGLGSCVEVKPEGDSHRLKFELPQELAGFIAPKGSITLDGISLTVNEVEGNVFGVNIIPHTWEMTTLGGIKEGQQVHIEIDMLARYVARLLEVQRYG
ncbi:MAG: riboflavin synthase [Alphaproteobacteria bacterium]|nr:riboflavin synthase [Alphaproteobacteria bacterium]